MDDRRSSVAQERAAPMSDLEQMALAALAGAFTGVLIWLYYVVFRFAMFALR